MWFGPGLTWFYVIWPWSNMGLSGLTWICQLWARCTSDAASLLVEHRTSSGLTSRLRQARSSSKVLGRGLLHLPWGFTLLRGSGAFSTSTSTYMNLKLPTLWFSMPVHIPMGGLLTILITSPTCKQGRLRNGKCGCYETVIKWILKK